MITAVLDANVLASGFVRSNPAAAPAQLIDAWQARSYRLALSAHIIAELIHTFEDPYFRRRLTAQQRARFLALLQRRAIITPITAPVEGVATHPEDDLVLATAVSAEAAYLVTGDIKLQQLRTHSEVTILSPRAFLNLLLTDTA